ncbi:hypothetical protein ACROYT_G013633 [Oculina patagonica]
MSKSQASVLSRKRSADEDFQEEGDTENDEKRRETHAVGPAKVIDWSPEQVKKWIFGLFGEAVAEKFLEEEIDGRALLESKRLEEDSTLEKLGIATIGKKERFKRELGAVRPDDNIHPFGQKKKKIDCSSFRSYDRLLTREEREHLSCKDKSIYNTKKKRITKEVEKKWPKGSTLPNYRSKVEAMVVDQFVEKIAQDESVLFPECGLRKEAILEIVLKKIREQRRQQKDVKIPLRQEDVLSTDSAESESSNSSSPPSSQFERVKRYSLYFDEDMTQSTAELIVMVALQKSSIKDVKMEQLHKMRKLFNLGLLRGKDKMTHVRAIANSLKLEGYVTISEVADGESLTRNNVQIAKEIALD